MVCQEEKIQELCIKRVLRVAIVLIEIAKKAKLLSIIRFVKHFQDFRKVITNFRLIS
jgi:hypothetical protein